MALPISRSDLMLPETDNFARRHDRIINQEITVHNCLENNNLFVLDSLADLPEDEAVAEVLENLEIEPEREDRSRRWLFVVCPVPYWFHETIFKNIYVGPAVGCRSLGPVPSRTN